MVGYLPGLPPVWPLPLPNVLSVWVRRTEPSARLTNRRPFSGRVSAWSRGPVVVLQLLLGLFGYSTAFPGGQPLLGIPLIVLAVAELYLLATPEARLAFYER